MPLAFLPSPNLSPFRRPSNRHLQKTCCAPLPSSYDELQSQAITAVKSALIAKIPLIEVQFPPISNMATAALNQLLDANRTFTRTFLLSFTPRYPPRSVVAIFPDAGETKLARKVYGQVPFDVVAMPKREIPGYLKGEGVVCCVNPGFNVDEWINMERLKDGEKSVICLNGDLDKVREGYYPKLFYPGLWKVKMRFLRDFEEVYYVKMFAAGGCMFRCFPGKWKVLWGMEEVLWEGEGRPEFTFVEKLLADRRMKR